MTTPVPDFTGIRLLVAGDLMLDRYWHGPVQRISPEAPVPVVHIHDTEDRAGGAGNVALNIQALGAHASLTGFSGDDAEADTLDRLLSAQGIDCHLIRESTHRTITKLRVISQHQQLIRLDFEDGFHNANFDALEQQFRAQLAQTDAVILSDYAKGALLHIDTLIRHCRDQRKPVLIDPKGNDFSRYRDATLITPNLGEFETIVGPCANLEELEAKGQNLLHQLNLQALLITRGDQGMTLIQRNATAWHQPANAREVYDVTGAGDTVIATLGTALAAGLPLIDATRLANLAAGIVVGKLGAASATPTELRAAAQTHTPLERGILPRQALIQTLRHARQNGERIVFTNGCFDILHPGHVAYLSQARQLGDRLIVAVNSDDSVKRLKGDDRPINPLMHRMAVLSGLESIDWVTSFDEDTPEKLIRDIEPDILVKGGDYKIEDIAGSEFVLRNGGQVLTLDFIDGASTTAIIEAIRKAD